MTKQEKAAVVSIATNLVLTIVKFILASVTASIALLAEAYHSFADILSSTMVFMAVRADRRDRTGVSGQEPAAGEEGAAPDHKPRLFAPGNWENKVAMGIGILLIFAAINIFTKVSRSETIAVRYPLVAAIIVSFLALCSYLLYRFEVAIGTDTGSTALVADGHHAQTDMLASALVVIALIASRLGGGFDRIAAGIIGFYILINAFYILTQAVRSYVAIARGHEFSRDVIYEDILFSLLYRVCIRLDKALWALLARLPGLRVPPETVKRRFTLTLLGLIIFLGVCVYVFSGFYILRPGEQAIVERFGKALQKDSPIRAGLHYHWPWPVERVKKADVGSIRRLTIGYKTGQQKDLILWTNKHYLREYSVITGEGPFLDVAMNVHYRIENLYQYLFAGADPDGTVEKIGYQVQREELGTRPFFATITAERDALESRILAEMQRRIDKLGLGVSIQNVCFRDLHPPTQVAAAFEDVVSAQEDYETYIEQAHAYRKDLLPRARAEAATTLNDAEAYRTALVAQSKGQTQAFMLRTQAFMKAPDLNQTRLVLETLEGAIADIPKYIVAPCEAGREPDIWLSMPSFARDASTESGLRRVQPRPGGGQGRMRITDEEDLLDALERFQQERMGEGK
jgi:membrane protease subunit HflK